MSIVEVPKEDNTPNNQREQSVSLKIDGEYDKLLLLSTASNKWVQC